MFDEKSLRDKQLENTLVAMKKALGVLLVICLVLSTLFIGVVTANPSMIPPDTPPIVSVSSLQINAEISRVKGQLWATVDIDYKTDTIHGFGDSYTLPKKYASSGDTSNYYTIQVVSNKLEAHYPFPLNAKNFTVSIDNKTEGWQIYNRGF